MALAGWLGLSFCAAGCDPTSEGAFIAGRGYVTCLESLPACPGQSAACVLDGDSYTEKPFPGVFSFLVEAPAGAEIEVQIYLKEQRDAGLSTLIFWNEPGCSDVYTYDSRGEDLFLEAEETKVIERREKIHEGGEHLVEINSDMQAHTLIGVDVIEPDS